MGNTQTDAPLPHPDIDIWAVFRALRDSRKEFGLRASHVQTLQAMLSFLKPGHGNTVFASNDTICQRVGGIDERTLRRHIDRFVGLGFIKRNNSSNGKRYRIRSSNGQCISYGLSLTPLIERSNELLALAQRVEDERRDRIFLRKQILTKLAHLEIFDPDSLVPQEVRKILRRTLTLTEHRTLLAKVDVECEQMSTAVDEPETLDLPANDGQTARHQSTSREEHKENENVHSPGQPELQKLISVCKQASSFTTQTLASWSDVKTHARKLAPMMGIDPKIFQEAANKIGARKASCAIFIMLQLADKIRNFEAYFHSITLGRRAKQFNPKVLLEKMSGAGGATC